jgi:hypothetical protein
MFNLSAVTLRRLVEINSFPEPTADHELVFFGLRGCVPRDPDHQRFADGHDLELARRCRSRSRWRCDRTEFETPYDNLHAGWCMGLSHDSYASAGCQVIVGYPRCVKRGAAVDVGPWKVFKKNAYDIDQSSFPYTLLDGRSAQSVAIALDKPAAPRVRFGSQGPRVEALQRALQKEDFYEGRIDGDFAERTIRAVLKYQSAVFGPDADDGVVGPMTASALKIKWETV